jgi:hypothetical protein
MIQRHDDHDYAAQEINGCDSLSSGVCFQISRWN